MRHVKKRGEKLQPENSKKKKTHGEQTIKKGLRKTDLS